MRSALTATQMVLSREERLSALGGLAAAAAHELGTPLATIQLTAREMAEELGGEGGINRPLLQEDANLLVSQAKRCRDILGRLSNRGDEGDAMHNRVRLDSLLKEAANPFLDQLDGPEIVFDVGYDPELSAPPTLSRHPEIIYGLRNFIENAMRYAREEVRVSARWGEDQLSVTIRDDGPGFSQDVLARLGEPYVNPRPAPQRRKTNRLKLKSKLEGGERESGRDKGRYEGLGLGFFIAKTLLERTQAVIYFENIQSTASVTDRDDHHESGALVGAVWPVSALRVEWPETTSELT